MNPIRPNDPKRPILATILTKLNLSSSSGKKIGSRDVPYYWVSPHNETSSLSYGPSSDSKYKISDTSVLVPFWPKYQK